MTYVLGKIAVITGAGSGIGRALALQLNREGCELYLSDINGDSLRETLAMLARARMSLPTAMFWMSLTKRACTPGPRRLLPPGAMWISSSTMRAWP